MSLVNGASSPFLYQSWIDSFGDQRCILAVFTGVECCIVDMELDGIPWVTAKGYIGN